MPWAEPHPPSARKAVRGLMCESDLSARDIAAQTGVPYATVCKWNQVHGWRPSATRVLRTLRPERFSSERIVAIGRIFTGPGVDPADLAEAIGMDREKADAFFRRCGFPAAAGRRPREGLPGEELRAMLRLHVARQIAAHDADLTARSRRPRAGARLTRPAAPPPADSAKLLRDLAGLKRLLDDLDASAEKAAEAAALATRRAEIAAERELQQQCSAIRRAAQAHPARR